MNTSPKIAYIINGQLRVKNTAHASQLNQLLKNGQVYLTTYPTYAKTAKFLTHKQLLIANPPKLPQDGLYQYWMLQHTIRTYKIELQQYDMIFRYRTDLTLKIANLSDYIAANFTSDKFYAITDWVFCCNAKIFIQLFENVYDDIMTRYINRERIFLPVNWGNLKITLENNATVRAAWLNLPAKYFTIPVRFYSMLEAINKYRKELEELNNDPHNSKIPTITYERKIKQRQSRPLSTEKFIVLYVTHTVPIYPMNIPAIMAAPHERSHWKL
jgi:hypothetical protein